jgi:hypothetical protein
MVACSILQLVFVDCRIGADLHLNRQQIKMTRLLFARESQRSD